MSCRNTSLSVSHSLELWVQAFLGSVLGGAAGALPFLWLSRGEPALPPSGARLALFLLAVFVGAAAALLAVTVVSSHRVAGVLFRLERLAALLERRVLLDRVHLRPRDEVRPLVSALNAWVAGLRGRVEERRAREAAFEAALARCEGLSAAGAKEELTRGLAEIHRLHAEILSEGLGSNY
ncbi:MAG: hypothetical protein ACNA8S_13900, partial [Deferrisomatales bacterium]